MGSQLLGSLLSVDDAWLEHDIRNGGVGGVTVGVTVVRMCMGGRVMGAESACEVVGLVIVRGGEEGELVK